MLIKQLFLKALSLFSDKPISKGIGITTDDQVLLTQQPSLIETGQPESDYTVKYNLRNDAGQFELLGLIRRKTGVSYKLRQNKTGDVFIISESLFGLLFKKCS